MKKKLSLLMVMLVAMITSAWADTVVLSSPTESVKTHSDANGIITITDASDKTGIQAGSGTLSYGDASATPMKLSGSRQFNLSYSSAVTITKVTLYATDNKADGNTYTIGTSSSDKTSLGNLPAKGSTPAAIDITGKTGLYATAQFLAVIVVEYSTTAPSLTATPTALTLSLNPSNPSAQKTFTLKGKNLTNGTYDLSIPKVTGLTVAPTSFTVASGAVDQEFTVKYESTEDVAKATAEIATPTINDLSATVAVTYQSRATAYSWATVSDAATWDWSKLTETVELTDDTTPNKTDEFLLADLDDRINFVDAFGDPKAIKMEATQFPSRGGFAQGTYVKFKTATAGTIDVDFSNTGGNRPDRYLQVNGQSTMFKSNTADKVSATAVPVPAGEVILSGWLDDGDNSGANMLRWYKITYTPSEPEPVVMPDDAEDWSVTEGMCTVVQTEMPLTGQTAKVAFEESGDVYMQVSVAGATVTLKGRFNSSSNLVTFPKGQTATVGSTTVYLMGAASLAGDPTDIEFKLDETKTTLTQFRPYIVASGNKDAIVAVAFIQNLKLQKPADEPTEVTDVLTLATFGVTGTTYADASGKTATSQAIYAANLAGGNNAIQLRSNNNNSGIITTASGGTVKSIKIEWNTNTADARVLDVYGKTSAYSSASDLYDSEKQGTKIASFTKSDGTQTVTIQGDYQYIGFRSNNGAMYIDKITIVWDASSVPVPAVATPVISGETPFVGETEVTITCETEGAKIYYTKDGTDPTTTSTEYNEAFTITETTTVKAIAAKDDALSEIVTKTFTAVPTVATLAAANALDNNTAFVYTGKLLVVAKPTDKYVYVEDDNSSGLIFDNSGEKTTNLSVGATIAPDWKGHVSVYKQLIELVPDQNLAVTADDPADVVYETVGLDFVKLDNVNQVVKLEGVTYTKGEGKNLSITEEGNDMVVPGYNQFGLEIADPEEGKTYDIVGAVSRYNDNVQFQPITIKVHPQVVDIEVAVRTGNDITDEASLLAQKIDEVTNAGNIVGHISIYLEENGTYTTSKSIVAPNGLTIKGNGTKGATIDATNLGDNPFVILNGSTETVLKADGTPSDHFLIEEVSFVAVTIKGMKNSLIKDNQKTYLKKLEIGDCVIEVPANGKSFIDFNGKGYVELVSVNGSSIYAKDKHTGFFAQYGSRPLNINADWLQKFVVSSSTIVNIANGKNFCDLKQKGTAKNVYELTDNLFVDCGKQNQVVVGFNGGQPSATPQWTVTGNAFNWGGADVSAAETEKAGKQNEEDIVKNSIAGVMTFTSLETPDLGGTFKLAEGATAPVPPLLGDGRWSITFEEPAPAEIVLWSSEEATSLVWDQANITIPAEAFANVKVGDVISVELQDVLTEQDATWKAQVELRAQNWKSLENSVNVAGTASVPPATVANFIVTGDIKTILQSIGAQFNGTGCKTAKIVLVPADEVLGSDQSIWVGSQTGGNINISNWHFANANNFEGVKVGDIIRVTSASPQWLGMAYNKGYDWTGFAEGDVEFHNDYTNPVVDIVIKTEAAAAELNNASNNHGVFIVTGDEPAEITQVELIAPTPEVAKFYMIGGPKDWKLDDMTELTFNEETQAYEYEYAPTTTAYFAFSDKQFTAEEAAADGAWGTFHSNNRYSLGAGDVDATLNEALTLVKGVEGTIVLKPVKEGTTYKISVAKDLSTVTITGEAAPESDYTFIIAGTPAEIFGTEWDASNQANLMEKQNDGTYAKTYTVDKAYENVQLKVVKIVEGEDPQWIGANGQNVSFSLSGAGSFTVTIDPETNEITVTGDNVVVPTGFDYSSVYAVGNGSDGWLNGESWTPNAEANKMTKVDGTDDVWEITFKDVPATPAGADWYQVKFAIDGSWDNNFGGEFSAFGEVTAAVYDGGNIAFELTEACDVTLRLDLTDFDFATKQGATFAIIAPALDKSALEAEIATATTLLGDASTEEGPGKDLADAIAAAQDALKKATTQAEIDAALNDLKTAEEAFEAASGIRMVNAAKYGEGKWYTMQGVEIPQPTNKGMYIHNGRTVVVK